MSDDQGSVETFARVFVKSIDEVPADAQAHFDPRHGVYFKLHLDNVSVDEAEPLLAKARERFDLHLVRRATKGDLYKERVYIDHPSEAPEGFKVHQGTQGGLYYETGLQQVGVNGGETRNVAVIHWTDVEIGDDIVYEGESGEQFAEIVDIDEREAEADIIHVETGEGVERALPGTYTVDVAPEEKSEGTVTSDTGGVHSARYSPEDEDEEPELPLAGDFDKSLIEKEWVPYTGPQGGQGWRNRRTGEIRYQENSPAVTDGEDDEGQASEPDFDPFQPPSDGYASGWTAPPESTDVLQEGQALEYFEDGYGYGEVVEASEGSVVVETEAGETQEIDVDSITATEIDRGLPDLPDVDVKEVEPEAFNDAVRQRMEENPEMGSFLTEHDPEEFEDYTLLMSERDDAGIAVSPEGDIQNLFALDDAERFVGRVLFKEAIAQGGRTLDCYDGYLRDFYDDYGFRETGRMEFNPEFAPEDFNVDRFGHPDVVFMHYDPEGPSGRMSTDYYGGDEWGDAKQESRRAADTRPDEGEAWGDLRRGERGLDPDAGAAGRRPVAKQDTWVSFIGPEGGQGWVNLATGEKRYQAARPGEAPEGHDEPAFAEGWTEPPEDPTTLLEGQRLEVEYDDEYHQGEVVEFDAEGVPMIDDDQTDVPYAATMDDVEVTAVEELGDQHPADPEMVSLTNEGAATWAQDFEPGDGVWLDTTDVTVIDGPADQMEVMGWVDEGYNEGSLAVKPTQPFKDKNPNVTHIAIEEENLLSEEEAEGLIEPYNRMEDFGWEVGDEMYFRDSVTDELHEAEVIDPIDGEIVFETSEGARYFPTNDEHMELIEPGEYAYDPADFGWDEEWEMGEVGPGGAVWVDSEDAPYLVSSAPHSDDEHIAVQTEAGNEWVPIEDIPVYAPNQLTPPSDLGWPGTEPPDIEGDTEGIEPGEMVEVDTEGYDTYPAYEGEAEVVSEIADGYIVETPDGEEVMVGYGEVDGESEGPGDPPEGYNPDAEQIPGSGPHTDDYEGYDTDGMDEGDWTPLTEVNDETVDDGDHVMVVMDYDHKDGKEAHIGEAHQDADGGWNIDVHNHDQKDWNLDKPVNGSDVEAYIATPHVSDTPSEGAGGTDDTTTPSEDEASSAVAQPVSDDFEPASYTPEQAEEFRDMSDIGANHGNSVAAMEVAVMPDGSKMVHKDLGHHSVEESDIKREMVGYEAAKLFDDNVPVHAADVEGGWAASEVAPGVDAKDATPEMQQAVDQTDFHEMAAAQVIIGNSDLHQNNLRVDEDGRLYPFDLDRAGGDITGDWVGNLSQYENTLDRTLGEMEKSATALGVQMDREEILQRAKQKAEHIDIESDLSAAAQWDIDLTDVIADNIEALRNDEVTL